MDGADIEFRLGVRQNIPHVYCVLLLVLKAGFSLMKDVSHKCVSVSVSVEHTP